MERAPYQKLTLLWMFPTQEHQLVDRTADAQYYVAVFKPDLIRRACRGERYRDLKRKKLTQEGVLHTILSPQDFDHLRREMDAIIADGIDPDLLNREAGFGLSSKFSFQHNDPDWLNAGLRHLLLSSWRLQQGCGGTNRRIDLHPAVRKALKAMEEDDGNNPLPLARRCGVSEAYLSRIFHKQVGVKISRYRNSIRLGRFWEAYRDRSNPTIVEAVYAAGFGSYAQFYRVFAETYGKGPREVLSRRD